MSYFILKGTTGQTHTDLSYFHRAMKIKSEKTHQAPSPIPYSWGESELAVTKLQWCKSFNSREAGKYRQCTQGGDSAPWGWISIWKPSFWIQLAGKEMTLFWRKLETMVLFKHNPQSSWWKNFHAKFTTSFSFKQTLKKASEGQMVFYSFWHSSSRQSSSQLCQEQPDTPQPFFWVETKVRKINWPPSGTEGDEHLK